jgi:hypothetical protein
METTILDTVQRKIKELLQMTATPYAESDYILKFCSYIFTNKNFIQIITEEIKELLDDCQQILNNDIPKLFNIFIKNKNINLIPFISKSVETTKIIVNYNRLLYYVIYGLLYVFVFQSNDKILILDDIYEHLFSIAESSIYDIKKTIRRCC